MTSQSAKNAQNLTHRAGEIAVTPSGLALCLDVCTQYRGNDLRLVTAVFGVCRYLRCTVVAGQIGQIGRSLGRVPRRGGHQFGQVVERRELARTVDVDVAAGGCRRA